MSLWKKLSLVCALMLPVAVMAGMPMTDAEAEAWRARGKAEREMAAPLATMLRSGNSFDVAIGNLRRKNPEATVMVSDIRGEKSVSINGFWVLSFNPVTRRVKQ